jgi:membrane-bound lytic murein transglycosylase A
MSMRGVPVPAAVVLATLLLAGCEQPQELMDFPMKDYNRPLPPGAQALRKITDPSRIPDFTKACAQRHRLVEAIDRSLHYLAKPSSQDHYPCCGIEHARVVASLESFRDLLAAGLSPDQMDAAVRHRFDVYESVGCDMQGTVLVTCYYTPIFEGSLQPTAAYRWPLYAKPANLQKGPGGNPVRAWPDRRTLEASGMLKGLELVYLADPFEAYVAQVQGSVKIRLRDGSLRTYGYTANNGHEYRSIRAMLVEDGKIGRYAGLPEMIAYFKAHPDEVQPYTWRNPRYVFFDIVEDGRPRGCLNEPVTTGRTVATDKEIFPPAALGFLVTELPVVRGGEIVTAPYRGFVLDQDAGGAIRAPGRCDLYLGVGEEAGELAGRAKNEGRLYYLFLKPAAAPTGGLRETQETAGGG